MQTDIWRPGFWADLFGVEFSVVRTARLWVASLAIGLTVDLLFWEAIPPGVSFPLFVAAALTVGTAFALDKGVRPAPDAILLAALALVLAMVPALRREPLTQLLGYLGAFGFAALYVHTYRHGGWTRYRIIDHLLVLGQVFLALGLKPLVSVLTSPSPPRDRPRAPTLKAVAPLVRGILLAVPIVLLFGALLASADVVFSSRVQGVIDFFESLFSKVRAGELVFRGFLILCFSYLAAAAMLHGLRTAPGAERPGSGELERMFPELDVSRLPRLGVVESSIVLGSVNVLFAAFVFIQFRYLFGGRANIDAEGFTFAEYARQGFGELLGVAVLSLVLLFVLSVASRAEKPSSRRLFTILGIALVLFVGVILVSAFQRLLLYEEAFGFTRARTWGHVFMVWLGLVLLALVILQATSRLRFFALAFLTAAVGFVVSLAILDVDSFIVERNMQRARAGAELDLAYLTSLSQDAVPAMVEAYEEAPSELRAELGAALVCFASELEIPHDDWRTSHLSALRARKALAAVAPDLEYHRTADCPQDWTI